MKNAFKFACSKEFLGGIFGLLLLIACQPKVTLRHITLQEVQHLDAVTTYDATRRNCQSIEVYTPSPKAEYPTPIRYVRVNFHFMNSSDSTANYSYKTGTHFARDIIKYANNDLADNRPMNLPLRNTTDNPPTRYRYVLTSNGEVPGDEGIYFHYDEELCYFIHNGKNRNSTDKRLIEKYCVNPDSVLNVFVLPHHPDSVISKTYSHEQTGIALGTSVKISGIVEKKKYQPWVFRGLLNHEIGHVLGIHHTWRSNDGCDDTPKNPNCWHGTKDGSPCDSLNSNNVMDYNLNQNSWTPCQLGKIHRNFNKFGSRQRKLLIPDWCQLDTTQTIYIRDSVHWIGSRDLKGHLVIEKGGYLEINCRVSLPKAAQIRVLEGGELLVNNNAWLHNDCDEKWEGIKVIEENKKGLLGKVTFIGKPKLHNMKVGLEEKEKENQS